MRTLPLLLLPLLAVPAHAQETQASAAAKFSREFKAGDANKDGSWSKAEVQSRLGRMKLATGGKPDPVRTKKLAELWFARADVNRNGKVTEAEAQALLAAVFRRYDVNGDGKVGGVRPGAAPAIRATPRPQGR
jgi:hypothetical protein